MSDYVLPLANIEGSKYRNLLKEMTLEMIRDVLSFTEKPDDAIPRVLDELRELTGAKVVLVYRNAESGNIPASETVLAVNPERKRQILENGVLERFIDEIAIKQEIVVISSANELQGFELISEIGLPVSLLLPLKIGSALYGGIILLGLPTTNNLEIIIEGLDSISNMFALVIRYSQLYSDIEGEVRIRTSELTESERKLRDINQQLTANEQKLRAANQQLEANEQQLRAANQQLEAHEQQLIAANEQLEANNKLLKEGQEKLLRALEKAEESERLKSAFLANMSHEIRTPMNGILGFIELINQPEISGTDRLRFSEIVQKSGHRLLSTINDIIEISQIEANVVKVTNSHFNINNMIEELLLFFSPEAKKKELKLLFEPGLPDERATIFSDDTKIHGILTNLIKNALKFTSKGSVKLGYRAKGNFLEFYVKDTGFGIPESRRVAIFDRFVQSDIDDRRALQGSGLGLAISKAYVEQMGGKIWVNSVVDQGSEFLFTIPNASIPDLAIADSPVPEKQDQLGLHKLKVLIAEDDQTSSFYLETLLKDHCSDLYFAGTGFEAVEICREIVDLDVVLMDLRMPVMDGYDATREIRQFNKEIIIIAQTAHAMEDSKRKVMESGFDDYIAKPVKKAELFRKMIRFSHKKV